MSSPSSRRADQARNPESTPPEYATSKRPSERRPFRRACDLLWRISASAGGSGRRADINQIVSQFRRRERCALIQPLQPLDSSEGPHVGEAEGKVIGVFIAYRAQGKPLVLKSDAAAIPVVIGLHGGRLDVMQPAVDAYGRC